MYLNWRLEWRSRQPRAPFRPLLAVRHGTHINIVIFQLFCIEKVSHNEMKFEIVNQIAITRAPEVCVYEIGTHLYLEVSLPSP